MICNHCKSTIPDVSNFCPQCGVKIDIFIYCSNCGNQTTSSANFCYACGSRLVKSHPLTSTDQPPGEQTPPPQIKTAPVQEQKVDVQPPASEKAPSPEAPKTQPTPTPQTAPTPPTQTPSQKPLVSQGEEEQPAVSSEFEKFMPKHIVDQIMKKGSLQEEMKNVAVMFADVSGFTAMSEEMDPEEVTNIMNECFQRLVAMVDKYDGTVNKFIGDCVMAIFGAPVTHENDEERAVRCALDMLNEIKEFNKQKNLDKPLGLSIGINSGKVFAGIVGSAMRKEYTVMGDTVNLSQRLESAAARGEILVGINVYRVTKDLFEYEKRDPIALKGKKEKVPNFVVLSEKKVTEEKKIDFVWDLFGREKETEKFNTILESFEASKGQVIYISGESGIGKSRLVKELFTTFSGRYSNSMTIKCAAASHSSNISYSMFQELLRNICMIDIKDDEKTMKQKIESLTRYGLDINECHFIGLIFFLQYEDSNVQFFEEEKKKLAIFLAIKKLIFNVSNQVPLVISLDNIQWIDPLSKELLDFTIQDINDKRIILFVSSRFDYSKTITENETSTIMTLKPLPKATTFELIKAILVTENVPDKICDFIWMRSAGNPLFTEEIIKSFVDEQKFAQDEDGNWTFDIDVDSTEIPYTIHGMIAARVDRLAEQPKMLLQHLSVVGREFPYILLKEIVEDFPKLEENLKELEKREMVFVKTRLPELVYIFKSLLLMEVSYGTILKKKLTTIHGKVGSAIEKIFADRLGEYYELLAHHFLKTENTEKALIYLEKSGDKLANEYQLEGANNYYKQAIQHITQAIKDQKLDDKKLKETLMSICHKSGSVAMWKGDLDFGEKVLSKLLDAAKKTNNSFYSINALMGLGRIKFLGGDYGEAINLFSQGLKISEETDSKEFAARVRAYIGETYERKGEPSLAIKELEQALPTAEEIDDKKLISDIRRRMGTIFLFTGEYDKALDNYNKALELADEIADKRTALAVQGNIGIVYGYQKDFEKCLQYYNKALEIAQEIGDKISESRNLHNIGDLYLDWEKDKQALKHFEKSLPISQETGWQEGYATNLIYVGYLKFMLTEEKDQSIETLKKGIDLCEKYNFNRALPLGKYLLGKVYHEKKDDSQAKKLYDEALKIAEETGYKKLVEDISKEKEKIQSTKSK